ncbi:hypothetical protein [Lichenibacterium dinghuense]|uniref:hypothetical protein n=1 Tax=Lichenibacterium dinghuense TaxID=2895977 RepID=UPI001F3B6D59|nr:hypothetical protein [Lichenibacterium sp. 6Y81]
MIRTATVVAAAWLAGAAPALAQRNDGIDNSPDQQRVADEFRSAGSKCDAPACRNDPDGVYPPSTGQGATAKTPSISAGQPQPHN